MKPSASKSSTTSCSWWMLLVASLCFLLAATLGTACKTISIPPVKTYEQAKAEVEKRGPLVTKPIEQREDYKPGKSQVVQKDAPAPYKGIIIDETKATYYVAVKAERDRRLKELEAARKNAAIKEVIYESTISHLKAKALSQGTWWEQNKGLVGFGLGVTIGMAIVIGLVYGLTRGDGVNSTTPNAHVLVPVR